MLEVAWAMTQPTNDDERKPVLADLPDVMTDAFATFYAEQVLVLDLDKMVSGSLMSSLMDTRITIESASTQVDESLRQWFERILAILPSPDILVDTYRRLLLEMVYCKSVNNFLSYISDILATAYNERPGLLDSKEPVTLGDVLELHDPARIIQLVAERRVSSLSFESFDKLAAYFQNQHDIILVPDKRDLEEVNRACAIRNAVTHNRGKVDRRFRVRIRDHSIALGSGIDLYPEFVSTGIGLLTRIAADIDRIVVAKLSLSTPVQRSVLLLEG